MTLVKKPVLGHTKGEANVNAETSILIAPRKAAFGGGGRREHSVFFRADKAQDREVIISNLSGIEFQIVPDTENTRSALGLIESG